MDAGERGHDGDNAPSDLLQLTNLLQLFVNPENSNWFSITSIIIFYFKMIAEHVNAKIILIICAFLHWTNVNNFELVVRKNVTIPYPGSGKYFLKTGSVVTAIPVHVAFSLPPRLTGTIPVQKRLLQQFRKHFQTYLTPKSNLLNVWKNVSLIKQTQVHAKKSVG